MGLKQTVDAILTQSLHVAYRPTAGPIAQGAHNIFQLVGGPALVKGFFAYADTATGAASTFQVSYSGVVMENAAVACNMPIGSMSVWPLTTGAGNVIVPNLAAQPYIPLASVLLGVEGLLISPGSAAGDIFILTIGAADTVGNTSFFVIYYKMRPQTLIVPL